MYSMYPRMPLNLAASARPPRSRVIGTASPEPRGMPRLTRAASGENPMPAQNHVDQAAAAKSQPNSRRRGMDIGVAGDLRQRLSAAGESAHVDLPEPRLQRSARPASCRPRPQSGSRTDLQRGSPPSRVQGARASAVWSSAQQGVSSSQARTARARRDRMLPPARAMVLRQFALRQAQFEPGGGDRRRTPHGRMAIDSGRVTRPSVFDHPRRPGPAPDRRWHAAARADRLPAGRRRQAGARRPRLELIAGCAAYQRRQHRTASSRLTGRRLSHRRHRRSHHPAVAIVAGSCRRCSSRRRSSPPPASAQRIAADHQHRQGGQ